MSNYFEDVLRRKLENLGHQWSEADIAVAVTASVDLAALEVRKAAGENVETELAHARAAVHSIAAGTAVGASTIVRDTITGVIISILKGLVI